jgi:hypothetical protein
MHLPADKRDDIDCIERIHNTYGQLIAVLILTFSKGGDGIIKLFQQGFPPDA